MRKFESDGSEKVTDNISQVGGNSIATNSGISSSGTIRVVIATDQPAFSTPVPVSGTVTANAGTGTFTVSGTVTANAGTGTFIVDGSAVTQPISGTVTANAGTGTFAVSGTVTANAGTGNFNVVGTSSDNSSNSTTKVSTLGARANASPPTWVESNQVPLSVDLSGNLRTSGSVSVTGTVAVTQSTSPWVISGTVTANVGTTGGLALDSSVTALQVAQGSTTSGQSGSLIQGAVTTGSPSYTTAQTSPLSLTPSGALRTDSSSTTQPISGTVTANAGSGTFTVGGTVTANAGTGNFIVVGTSSDDSANSTAKLPVLPVRANAVAPTWTEGNQVPISADLTGAIRVNVVNASSGGTSSLFGSAFPTLGTASGFSDGTNMREARVFDADTGAGTEFVLGVNLRSSSSGGSTELLGQQVMASSVPVVISSNQSSIPVAATQSGTWTVQPGNTANTTPWLATINQGGNSATVTASNALKVDGSAVTQPVSGTVTANAGSGTFNIQSNASVNVAQISGTTTSTGNGVSGAGVQRVAIASDNTAFSVNATLQTGANTIGAVTGTSADNSTNSILKLSTLGARANASAPAWTEGNQAPLSVDLTGNLRTSTSIAANSSVNVNQIAGTATSVDNGTSNAGTIRVTLASDSTGQVTLATGSNIIGSLVANQSVNTAQINGVTPLMGNGITGTGSQRVTIASDNTAFSVNATIQTGSATIGAVTGTAADNSANSTLKLPTIGARANAAAPTWTEGNQAPLSVDLAGNQRVSIRDPLGAAGVKVTLFSNAGADITGTATNSDALSATGTALETASLNYSYDPKSDVFSRIRKTANEDIAASAARTATLTTADFINVDAVGAVFVLDITAVTGGTSVTWKVQGKDATSGKYYDILLGAAETSVVTRRYKVYPTIIGVTNVASQDLLPRTYRVVVTHSAAGSYTYSIGVCYMP